MSLLKILEDWPQFDDGREKNSNALFSCYEEQEAEHLIQQITLLYPQKSKLQVSLAINSCCYWIHPPRERKKFIACVLTRLELPV